MNFNWGKVKLLRKLLSAIISVYSSHHCARPSCVGSTLTKMISVSSTGYWSSDQEAVECAEMMRVSLSEGKWIERKMEKTVVRCAQ